MKHSCGRIMDNVPVCPVCQMVVSQVHYFELERDTRAARPEVSVLFCVVLLLFGIILYRG